MTIKEAHMYIKKYIDESFIVQNINKRYECDDIIEDIEYFISVYNKKRECRVFYDIDKGIISFTSVEILDEYSTDYDTNNYDYIETTLEKALKIFKLQNKSSLY